MLGDDLNYKTLSVDRLPAKMVAAWRRFSDPNLVLGVSSDGYKVGRPLEETQNYLYSDGEYGFCGAPMVTISFVF